MQFPLRKDFSLEIKGKSGIAIAELRFKEPVAMEVLQRVEAPDYKTLEWIVDLLRNYVRIIYPEFTPTSRVQGIFLPIWKRQKKKEFEKYVRDTIDNNFNTIANVVLKRYLKRRKSIFEGIKYPKLKGQKGRSRGMTFLESLIRSCNGSSYHAKKMLEECTLEQVDTMIDAKILMENEKVPEYQNINDRALRGLNGEDVLQVQKEIRERMKATKSKKLKFI